MKNLFNIFPKIGYKNSQFQIVSSIDNLKVDFYYEGKIVKSINTNSQYPIIIDSLNVTGKIKAKCQNNEQFFELEIEIKAAIRLGSSEFKKAFVFDNTDYSFFLMKDRLLLYDEKNKIILTENHYSPSEIYKIDKTNFLFVTKVGNSTNGITNLGIYNTDTFSLDGELLNNYQEIKILPESNIAWLYNVNLKTIHCFQIVRQNNEYFIELKFFENFTYYFIDDSAKNIFINYNEKLIFSNLENLHKYVEINKKENNAIDKYGNLFTIENNALKCTSFLTEFAETIKPYFNIENENLIHLGNDLKSKEELTSLDIKINEIKDEIITSLPNTKTYHYYPLPEHLKISDTYTTNIILHTFGGVYIFQKRVKRDFKGVKFKKHSTNWTTEPYTVEKYDATLSFVSLGKTELLIDKTPNLSIKLYQNYLLLVNCQNQRILFSGNKKITIENEDSINLFTINELGYFIIKSKEKHSLFRSNNLNKAILEQIDILNLDQYEKHQIIWFRGKEKYISSTKHINAFDLRSCRTIFVDEHKLQHFVFKDAKEFKFYEKYALSPNQIVFNPITLEVKDSFVGKIVSHSKHLNKIVSHRTDKIYLSKFNSYTGKFELSEISIEDNKYKESYLSPDGQFLVLQDESNKFSFYNIDKNETIHFFSGTFLAFRNDGSLLMEEDYSRTIKIIDPITFKDITPPNYHHYRFISPDEKLYAQTSLKKKYFNILTGQELTDKEITILKQKFDYPNFVQLDDTIKQKQLNVDINRLQIFNAYKEKFKSLGINDYNKINSQQLIVQDKYVEIGIIGTDNKKEIIIPTDTQFYNYAAFSFDNKYIGIVGKPELNSNNKSLILLCSIAFDESKQQLELLQYTISRICKKAAWICGFSKTGYFGTHDSTPNTFIIKIDNSIFFHEIGLKNNINNLNSNINEIPNKWNVIRDKNFLCFSPSGVFFALSEKGYEPLTLGGYGHQESNVVHIAKTESGVIINSFMGHGDKIKGDIHKNVTFVAFSEDESRIMTLSSDGVVIIRDLDMNELNKQFKSFHEGDIIQKKNLEKQEQISD